MGKTLGCPYRIVRNVAPVIFQNVEERFDFQICEGGKIDRISLGEFDVTQEVESHKGEVGLINCLKLAQAKGLDPTTAFAKVEDGLMADVGDIDTLDDLIKAKASADAKLSEIAKTYGLTTDQLIQVMQSGDLSSLKEPDNNDDGGESNA